MPLSSPHPEIARFGHLDTLRFVFAAIVVVGHAFGWGWVPRGALAVDFFFLLSGFVLAHWIVERQPKYWPFVKARIARMWPLHAVTAVVTVAIYYNTGGRLFPGEDSAAFTLLANLLFLQNSGIMDGLTLNFPSWSIGAEFWVNVLLLWFVVMGRRVGLAALLGGAALAVLLLYHPKFDHAHHQSFYITTLGTVRCVAGVMFGYLIYEITRRGKPLPWLQAVQAVLLVAALYMCVTGPSEPRSNMVAYGLMACLLAALAYPTALTRWLGHPVLAWLGNLSFAIYMIHGPLLIAARRSGFIIPNQTTWIEGAAYIAILMFLAVGSFYLLEKPAKKRILALGMPDRSRQATQDRA
jgi:peptidoglycan/LPS O-acetylase OafA/YrhL